VLPDGWTDGADRLSGIAITGYFGPVVDSFATNVNVVREPVPGLTLRQFLQATIQGVRATVNVQSLSPATARTVGGDPALEYSAVDQQVGRTLRQRQTLVIHGANGYVITFTALPDQYEVSVADADAILDSWQWG
jgi:hypothetical protein